MPSIKMDTGVIRRTIAYYHQSLFVDESDDRLKNNTPNIFLKDIDLITRISSNSKYLNAWLDILVDNCSDRPPIEGPNFKEAKDTLQSANDKTLDFIEKNLIITNKNEDRIGKEEMRRLYLAMYPNLHTTIQQIISVLKDKSINYSPQYRFSGVQGCFYGVKEKSSSLFVDDSPLDYNHDEQINLKKENKDLKLENQDLKEQVEILKIKLMTKDIKNKMKFINKLNIFI
jgi:hypothetical protein